MKTRPWAPPPANLDLEGDVVHVWRADLAVDDDTLRGFELLLAPDERARAARFRLAREQRRFVAGRGWLRAVLGRYLRCDPKAVPLAVEPGGKPRLAGTIGDGLQFSLSHSGDRALLAVARARRLGVDVESIRGDFEWQGIAAQLFTARELTRLAALSADQRAHACFRRWTRAEAWIKARGNGLAAADTLRRPTADDVWLVRALDAGPGYAAALAVEGRGWSLARYEAVSSGAG